MLYGNTNVGKTFIALDLASHVAAGMDWHGNRIANGPCSSGGAVIYIATEGSRGLSCRIDAIRIAHPGLYERVLSDQTFFLLATPVDLHGGQDIQALIREIQRLSRTVELIIVDTLARSMGAADENAARDMNALLSNIDRLRAETSAHVMMVHHTGKNPNQGARGSSVLRAAVATEIRLTRKGNKVVASADKQRDMVKGQCIVFSMEPIEVGYDVDDEPVSSLVIKEGAVSQASKQEVTGQAQKALAVLQAAITDDDLKSPDFIAKHGRRGIKVEIWRKLCDERPISTSTAPSRAPTAFSRARDSLEGSGIIEILDGYVFLTSNQ